MNHKYRNANDEIEVSAERKAELVAMMQNARSKKGAPTIKFIALAASVAVFFTGIAIAAQLFHQGKTPINQTEISNSQQVKTEIYFNDSSALVFQKIKMFQIYGEEKLSYKEILERTHLALPLPSADFEPEEVEYRIFYSEGWKEFVVDEMHYQNSKNEKLVVSAGKREEYTKEPFESLKSSPITGDIHCYFFVDSNNCFSVYYFEDDILYTIRAEGIEQERFVSLVSRMVANN